jgi:hypothetical protein
MLLFDILDEDGNHLISKSEFCYFIKTIFVQDLNFLATSEDILERFFQGATSISKRELIRLCNHDPIIKPFISTLLQCEV